MDSVDKPAEEIAFDELAAIVREKDELGISFTAYLQKLEKEAEAAQRKLEVARAHADTCSATKLRKPRRDRGTKRKKADVPDTPAEAAPASEL
jgi:hypothetical protein